LAEVHENVGVSAILSPDSDEVVHYDGKQGAPMDSHDKLHVTDVAEFEHGIHDSHKVMDFAHKITQK